MADKKSWHCPTDPLTSIIFQQESIFLQGPWHPENIKQVIAFDSSIYHNQKPQEVKVESIISNAQSKKECMWFIKSFIYTFLILMLSYSQKSYKVTVWGIYLL